MLDGASLLAAGSAAVRGPAGKRAKRARREAKPSKVNMYSI